MTWSTSVGGRTQPLGVHLGQPGHEQCNWFLKTIFLISAHFEPLIRPFFLSARRRAILRCSAHFPFPLTVNSGHPETEQIVSGFIGFQLSANLSRAFAYLTNASSTKLLIIAVRIGPASGAPASIHAARAASDLRRSRRNSSRRSGPIMTSTGRRLVRRSLSRPRTLRAQGRHRFPTSSPTSLED